MSSRVSTADHVGPAVERAAEVDVAQPVARVLSTRRRRNRRRSTRQGSTRTRPRACRGRCARPRRARSRPRRWSGCSGSRSRADRWSDQTTQTRSPSQQIRGMFDPAAPGASVSRRTSLGDQVTPAVEGAIEVHVGVAVAAVVPGDVQSVPGAADLRETRRARRPGASVSRRWSCAVRRRNGGIGRPARPSPAAAPAGRRGTQRGRRRRAAARSGPGDVMRPNLPLPTGSRYPLAPRPIPGRDDPMPPRALIPLEIIDVDQRRRRHRGHPQDESPALRDGAALPHRALRPGGRAPSRASSTWRRSRSGPAATSPVAR